ncbi:hypothetical protein GRJ2_000265300 [Grus japonensis]|uniref:Core shell protein Gag P30 domain-containing protein n=1 Tax=Grus japonensis TaxID=30415 RepID=A0ABC9VX75_GRUJA
MSGTYRKDPENAAQTLETSIENHHPDWKDMQVVNTTLFTFEEQRVIMSKAQEEVEKVHIWDAQARRLEDYFPTINPQWDHNNRVQRLLLTEYQRLILYGVQNAIPKPKNLSKIYQVVQGKDESPSAFYKQLCETARKYSDLDLDREKDAFLLVNIFIRQSNPDIRKKLQELEGEDARSLNKLLEAAWKVYNNREDEEKREEKRREEKRREEKRREEKRREEKRREERKEKRRKEKREREKRERRKEKRKGKERKGKERKGKERKGKERKGKKKEKERKEKKRKGKERKEKRKGKERERKRKEKKRKEKKREKKRKEKKRKEKKRKEKKRKEKKRKEKKRRKEK